MATIVRIKRNFCDEPLEAVVVSSKKRKVEIPQEINQTTVFRFIGTTKTQEENVLKHITLSKANAEEKYKKHISNLSEKLRQQTINDSKNSRYKIINCQRLINEQQPSNSAENVEHSDFLIYDIEDKNENTSEISDKSDSYLYDLYYAHWDDCQKGVEDNELISVYPLNDQLIYGSYRDNGLIERCSDESEDSNDENNWRNDYPDESDAESITVDDMLNAVKNIHISTENSLSSDDDIEIYADDDSEKEKVELDEDEVDRFGKMYARFKARVQKEEKNNDLYYGDIDDGEDFCF